MAEQSKQSVLIHKVSGKNSFFEAYDALAIGKIQLMLTKYDTTKPAGQRSERVSFYLVPEDIVVLGRLAAAGQLDAMLQADTKSFPSNDFGIPQPPAKTMRHWSMSKTDKGNYQITVVEKTRADSWNDSSSTEIGKQTFYMRPFDLIALATAVELYVLGYRNYKQQEVAPIQSQPAEDLELAME
jgi:hypothetical protein